MVEPRLKRWLLFGIFVLPALALYALFFLNPFANGIRISFTNWDGLTPRTPISLPRAEFEQQILSRIASDSDRGFLLEVYRLDESDGRYKRFELTGARRGKVTRILNRIGWRPEGYRYVGFDNFLSIFTGGVEDRFYPRFSTKMNFNEDSDLPGSIPRSEFERNLLPRLASPAERDLVLEHYAVEGDAFVLKPSYDGFEIEDRVWLLPEVDAARTVAADDVDRFLAAVKTAGLASDEAALESTVDRFLAAHRLSPASAATVRSASTALFDLGAMKHLLAVRWTERRLELGVVGFTLFFAFFNIVLSNVLAFALALSLDTGIRSRNVLRTLFFLPNVLSMVVVSLIWSFVFYHLLPALTGVELWMGDPAKAPWLLVMVQVWREAGYMMVIYLAGLQTISTDVLEAALIDGASWRQRLRHILLPLLVPAFTVTLFLSLSNSLKSFDLVYAMVGPSGYATGTVPIVMDIFFDAFAKKLAGLATAKAMLLFVVIAVTTGIQLTLMKRREVRL